MGRYIHTMVAHGNMDITARRCTTDVSVFSGNRLIGKIVEVADGFSYWPKGKKIWCDGESYVSVQSCLDAIA